ncbi:MAG: ShlB/FhaC/HecB family hemolysin secretion/activation protein [Nitrospirales bacterium]
MHKRNAIAYVVGISLVLIVQCFDPVFAQVPPGSPFPPQRPELPSLPPTPAPPPLAPMPVPPPGPESKEFPALTILVKDIALRGNTVFTNEQLREVTAPYTNRELTTEDIEALRIALTHYYINRGYVTSGAVVPDQDFANNVLIVQIIEGRLAKIDVEGNYWFRTSYIRSRIERGAGPPVNVQTLQEQLQLMQLDPRFERLNATLQPGLALGQNNLNLRVTESNPFKVRFGFNNYLSPTIGAEQGFVTIEDQNLTGFGDSLSVQYGRSSGANPLLNIRYAVPVHPSDTTLSLQYRRTAFAVQAEPFKALNIENRAEIYSVGLRQPLYRSLRHEFAVSLTGDHETSKSFLLGEPFEFVAGATNGVFRVSAGRFGQEYIYRTGEQVLSFLSRFSLGIGDVLDSNSSSSVAGSADGRFFAWLGDAQYVRQLDLLRTQLISHITTQLTPDHLFSLEQVSVGGRYSVRGYREFALVRDNAVLASVEVRVPVYANAAGKDVLFLAPFVDYGRAWNSQVDTPDPKTLASVGGGLIWNIPWKDSRFEVFWGKQLNRFKQGDGNLQDHGIHLQLVVQAF